MTLNSDKSIQSLDEARKRVLYLQRKLRLSRRAGCVATRTSGSEGGRRKRSRGNLTTAPPAAPTPAAGTRWHEPVLPAGQRALREGRHDPDL